MLRRLRVITPNLWNFQRVLHNLAVTQEVARHTRLHSIGSTRVPPTYRGAPFPPPSLRGGILLLRGRERIPGVSVASKRRRSHRKGERNSRVVPNAQSPPDVSVHSRETCFPCTASTFKPRIVSHNGGTWDSPVGKPSGKASSESHRSLDPREWKRDTAATAREESARAYPQSRRGLTPLGRLQKYPKIQSALERNPQVPGQTPHKILGPCIEERGIPRGPRATGMETGLS